ncbi:DUF1211 domain-containing protein [Kovacikia minuta CCNUW1]|uniref:TMEM175 family protein n=1 Tax=Kovacikia minuta TaxID=2931930 RepID=UPI001CCD2B0A|nr:TMEM175 family protein [Kovacikia minuta]UBF27991.1 DUF1211 domain-containing protein [Kovacikia minuta CCNUW1]
MEHSKHKPNLPLPSTSRLASLNECVYSIAMTLLVLNVKIPDIPKGEAAQILPGIIFGLLIRLHDYLISFMVLGSFWIASHQQLNYIQHVNRPYLWINLITLMFITLIPLSASLVGDYGGQQFSVLFFNSHLLIINLFFWLNRCYAKKNRMLKPEFDSQWVHHVNETDSLLNFGLIVWSSLWAFFDPHWAKLPFLLVPLTPILARRIAKL